MIRKKNQHVWGKILIEGVLHRQSYSIPLITRFIHRTFGNVMFHGPVGGVVQYACMNCFYSWHWLCRRQCEQGAKQDVTHHIKRYLVGQAYFEIFGKTACTLGKIKKRCHLFLIFSKVTVQFLVWYHWKTCLIVVETARFSGILPLLVR